MTVEDPSRPSMLEVMNTLGISIREISANLIGLVEQASYFSLIPHSADIVCSDCVDIFVQIDDLKISVVVAEPQCGVPDLSIVPLRDNCMLRNKIARFNTTIRDRNWIRKTRFASPRWWELGRSCIKTWGNRPEW